MKEIKIQEEKLINKKLFKLKTYFSSEEISIVVIDFG